MPALSTNHVISPNNCDPNYLGTSCNTNDRHLSVYSKLYRANTLYHRRLYHRRLYHRRLYHRRLYHRRLYHRRLY